MRKVIMSVEDDGALDGDNYQDIRMELNATGHNLTSVLINPRESIFDDIFDEFALEQSTPLEYDSPLAVAAGTQSSIFSLSSHSTSSALNRSNGGSQHGSANTSTSTRSSVHSHHSLHGKNSTNGRNSNNGSLHASSALYTTTPAEDVQLDQFVLRLKKIFVTYQAIHGIDNHPDRYMESKAPAGSPRRAGPGSAHNTSMSNLKMRSYSADSGDHTTRPSVTKSKWTKLAGDELRVCYREVPDLFFRSDFSLLSPEIFHQTLFIKDTISATNTSSGTTAVTSHTHGHNHTHATTAGVGGGEIVRKKDLKMSRTYSTEDVLEMMQRQGLDGRSQDVLSYYLDLVEVALLRQIWLRSPAFFRALDDIKGLQFQVSEATRTVCTARHCLQTADTAATLDPTRIPTLSTRQRNALRLHEVMLSMQRVVQGRIAIGALLEVEDYFSAMELIAAAKKVYHEQLSGIQCMRQLGNQLDDIDNLVCEVMCNKFVSLAIQWEDPTTTAPIASNNNSTYAQSTYYDELDAFSAPTPTSTDGSKLTIEASLKQLLVSLVLTERIQSALNMYKNRLLDAIKLIVRTCVMEYLSNFDPSLVYEDGNFDHDGSNSSGSSAASAQDTPFAQKVREMSGENFLSCLSMCYEHVMVSAHKANLFHQFVETHLSGANISAGAQDNRLSSASPVNAVESNHAPGVHSIPDLQATQTAMIAMSKACLTSACDLAQRSIAQLINLRKDANAKLVPEKMKFLWEISLEFVLNLEQVSGTTAYIMRQCLLAQTKSFLDYLHETCKGKMVVTLDNERWVQCDISEQRQSEVDRLSSGKAFLPQPALKAGTAQNNVHATPSALAGATSDSVTQSSQGNNSSSSNLTKTAAGNVGGISTSSKEKSKESRPAVVDGVQFKVVWSVMLLTEIILTYLEVAFNFSPVTADVINKTVELLRLFNSRARQLVLGAQAIQSAARLKSISAKHLAITGQSLGLIIALLPHIRAALLAQIPPKHQLLLTELDRVSHDLIDHHGQIVAKFVAIVGDFVDASATRLRAVDWDHFQGLQCEYFEEVQRNVLALHRVLQATLPPEQIQDVFSRIFALLNRKIPAHFEEIMPATQTGRQRILDEITHLVTAFSRIKQIDASALTDSLEETFRKRYMRER